MITNSSFNQVYLSKAKLEQVVTMWSCLEMTMGGCFLEANCCDQTRNEVFTSFWGVFIRSTVIDLHLVYAVVCLRLGL